MSQRLEHLFEAALMEHVDTVTALRGIAASTIMVAEECCKALHRGNKLLFCGNGGSAADSQHLATEITIRYERNRAALPAIALTTDTSALTAAVNDFGPEHMFARQVLALGAPGDLLIGITTSGNSRNILVAFEAAQKKGMRTICFSGRDGGKAKIMADICLIAPSWSTARIQEMHILIGHFVCAAIDRSFPMTPE